MVNNIRIGFATNSMEFTPTNVFSYSNGYDYSFENGQEFSSIIEEGSPSLSTGFTYGSTPKTNTFKAKVSGSMAQIKVLEQYEHIIVYKNNALVFCGSNPTFSKTIKKGVGRNGINESYVEAQMSFSDYSNSLKNATFSVDETFDLYYAPSDGITVCNTSDPSKSLIHILLGYLDPSGRFSLHFGDIPDLLKTTIVQYFSVTYEDKVMSILKDVLEQAGLAMYFDRMNIHIIDVLGKLSGTACNIPNIESNAVKEGRSFIEISIPAILMASTRLAQGVVVYDSGDMTIEGKDWAWSDDVYYPASDMYAEGSFSYRNKQDNEKEKRYFNFRKRDWYGEIGMVGNGAMLHSFKITASGVKYRVMNDGVLRRKFRLRQCADVLLFKYSSAFRPTDNWNKEETECDYIYSVAMAQRYADALMYRKKSQATYYDFYADTSEDYPNGYPINMVITLQGTDETNPLLLITTKTDKFDSFGGYTYRAIPYDRGNVSLSASYIESKESLPVPDSSFTVAFSRDIIECDTSHIPIDAMAVRITVNIKNRLLTPTLTINGTVVSMAREQVEVQVGNESEKADTNNWIYDLDANLDGGDTSQIIVTVNGTTSKHTISKLIPGAKGDDGYTMLTVMLYQRSSSAPMKPSQSATYNFETNTISGVFPWLSAVPSGDETLWVIHATAATRSTVTDDIEPSEWSEPAIMAKDGPKGDKGDDGVTRYSYFAYGTSSSGANFNKTPFDAATHIGVCVTTLSTQPTNPDVYTWSLTKGSIGPQGPQGPTGSQGPAGTPARGILMSASSILVSADRRAAGSVTPVVKLTITRQNLPGTNGTLKINNINTSVTWIGSMGTADVYTADVHMAIASLDDNVCEYTCSYNGQTYSAVLTIKRKDDTEYGRFLGALASAPSNSGALDGDYFVWNGGSGYTKGVTYRFNGSNWTQMGTNEPEKLLRALTAMKVAGVDFSTFNNPNTVSWFAQIISDQVIANTIKAINGFFRDITVDGNSTLKGNVDNFAFQTFTESESTKDVSLSFLVNNTSYAQLDIPGGTYRTRFINIKKIPINMTFKEIYRFWGGPAGEVYNAKSGSITVDGTTYSTSTHSITIMYNPMVFSIYAIPNGASDGGRIASFSFKTDNDYYPVDDTATIWIPTDSDVSASLKTSNKYTISSCSLVIETYRIAGAYIQNMIPKFGKDVMIGSPERRVTQVNARDVAALTVIAYNKIFGQLGDNSCNDDVYANNLYAKGGRVSIGKGDPAQSTGSFSSTLSVNQILPFYTGNFIAKTIGAENSHYNDGWINTVHGDLQGNVNVDKDNGPANNGCKVYGAVVNPG